MAKQHGFLTRWVSVLITALPNSLPIAPPPEWKPPFWRRNPKLFHPRFARFGFHLLAGAIQYTKRPDLFA